MRIAPRTTVASLAVVTLGLAPACISDLEDYDCQYRGFCTDPSLATQATCTPGQTEAIACGSCGEISHTCAADGRWGPLSACVDPKPGCNPCAEPTWEDPIDAIMKRRCNHCHVECTSYSRIGAWVGNGELERYTRANHFINGSDKTAVLRWLELGAPETACDVAVPR